MMTDEDKEAVIKNGGPFWTRAIQRIGKKGGLVHLKVWETTRVPMRKTQQRFVFLAAQLSSFSPHKTRVMKCHDSTERRKKDKEQKRLKDCQE